MVDRSVSRSVGQMVGWLVGWGGRIFAPGPWSALIHQNHAMRRSFDSISFIRVAWWLGVEVVRSIPGYRSRGIIRMAAQCCSEIPRTRSSVKKEA